MASRPGTIHKKIVELLRKHPEGMTSGQIRAKLELASHEQAQLDRRRRDLRKWFILEKRQVGSDWVYTLKGERDTSVLERGVNIRVRAAVLGRAHGRCQMCGRTVEKHNIVLVVDHKIPVDWGGSNDEENLWALCEKCRSEIDEALKNGAATASALEQRNAKARIKALLTAKLGIWVPATWLKAVACTSDWSRCMRHLRNDGLDVRMRRRGRSVGSVITYYRMIGNSI